MLKIKQIVVMPETRRMHAILYALSEDGTLHSAAICDESDVNNPCWLEVKLPMEVKNDNQI